MRKHLWIGTVMLASMLAGCEMHAGVYDPYRHDYHHWNGHERDEYHQWARENHHEDRDYQHLSPQDQQQYWAWRHQQDGH